LDRILPDDDNTFVQWLVALARGDTLYRSEARLHLADGVIKDTLFYATLPRDMRGFEDILVSDLDITAYKAAQSRVAQGEVEIAKAARIATMGALTASIAHEVNSPLAAIVTSSEAALLWLRREQPDIQEAVSAMLTVNQQAIRAQSVVDRARAYVNHSPIAMTPQSIGALVCEAIQLIQRDLLALRTAIHIDVPDQLPHVLADAVNIQQILVNLILNAAQAMEGKVTLKEISLSAEVTQRMMIVTVNDSGPGIDPELLPSIFDPFFTTKPQGMGMGLAICKTCIAAQGGELWVTNRPGQGAAFHFSLPLAPKE
jgi:C4-dicarboxylate-specific signal transduction histidine kinase